MKALLSVYNKSAIEEFGKALREAGYDLVSTGGTHDALRLAGLDVEQVLVPASAASHSVVGMVETAGIPCVLVADRIFGSLTTTRTSQPALAEVTCHDVPLDDLVATQGTALILAGVSDPGNAGTLVRSAEAFDAAGVVFANGVDPYNPKAVRAAAGSTFRVPIAIPPGEDPVWEVVDTFGAAGYQVLAAVTHGGLIPEEIIRDRPLALVVGSEPHGLSDSLVEVCETRVSLPTGGGGDSLNVAVAGSVLLYALCRPRSGDLDGNGAPGA
mgnify:CR=1 FL=1